MLHIDGREKHTWRSLCELIGKSYAAIHYGRLCYTYSIMTESSDNVTGDHTFYENVDIVLDKLYTSEDLKKFESAMDSLLMLNFKIADIETKLYTDYGLSIYVDDSWSHIKVVFLDGSWLEIGFKYVDYDEYKYSFNGCTLQLDINYFETPSFNEIADVTFIETPLTIESVGVDTNNKLTNIDQIKSIAENARWLQKRN